MCLERNKRYRNKRGRKFRANLRNICKIQFRKFAQICANLRANSRKSGQIRANSAKFACCNFFLTYTPVDYAPACSVPTSPCSAASQPRLPSSAERLSAVEASEEAGDSSARNKRYRNKRGRKFCANLRKICKMQFRKLRKFAHICATIRANSANFAQTWPNLYVSIFF